MAYLSPFLIPPTLLPALDDEWEDISRLSEAGADQVKEGLIAENA